MDTRRDLHGKLLPGAGPTGGARRPGAVSPPLAHPVDGLAASRQQGPALHYICSALSYQNQMLADIKALLQQLALDRDVPGSQAEDGKK